MRHAALDRGAIRSLVVLASLSLGACVPSGHLARAQASAPVFDPIAFFAGRTQGRGSLKIVARRAQPVTVEGRGVADADGNLVLDQDVRQGDGPVKRRSWHLRRTGPGRYAGTLSDAVGPVTADVAGNALHLGFMMKRGLRVRQWLYLQPGGRVSRNRMVVTKFGIPVASLDETITRLPE